MRQNANKNHNSPNKNSSNENSSNEYTPYKCIHAWMPRKFCGTLLCEIKKRWRREGNEIKKGIHTMTQFNDDEVIKTEQKIHIYPYMYVCCFLHNFCVVSCRKPSETTNSTSAISKKTFNIHKNTHEQHQIIYHKRNQATHQSIMININHQFHRHFFHRIQHGNCSHIEMENKDFLSTT